jgi:hypothetical protein
MAGALGTSDSLSGSGAQAGRPPPRPRATLLLTQPPPTSLRSATSPASGGGLSFQPPPTSLRSATSLPKVGEGAERPYRQNRIRSQWAHET